MTLNKAIKRYDDILILNNCYIKDDTIYSDTLYNYDYKKDDRFKNCVSIKVKESINNIEDAIIIEDPIIIFRQLHRCFGHVLIDNIFVEFCILNEINVNYGDNIKYMLRRDKGYKFLQDILPVELFNLHENKYYLFKKIYFHKLDHYPRIEWSHRSPFNLYYNKAPSRNLIPEIDSTIMKKQLLDFKRHTLKKYLGKIEDEVFKENNIIIIQRPDFHERNQRQDPKVINSIFINEVIDIINTSENCNFNGIFILEDMEYKDQIELFYKNNIIIAYTGSAALNMIYMSKNSTYIEIGQTLQHERIADLSDINYKYIHHNHLTSNNVSKIINGIKKENHNKILNDMKNIENKLTLIINEINELSKLINI